MVRSSAIVLALIGFGFTAGALAAVLTVGPGKQCTRPEDANKAAADGDEIIVFPQPGNRPYEQVALSVSKKRLTFRAASQPDGSRVKFSGAGRDYVNPRAVVQFNPSADGCSIDGFEIFGTQDQVGVSAGIRINQADNVTIRNCDIHDNNNGIFSNGHGQSGVAANQRVENCLIHHNGADHGPGSHNLYVAGEDITLVGCQIYASTSGHNFKSRAHRTVVAYCWLHDSANRELDLVDGKGDTDRPDSDVVLLGNLIVKDPKIKENPHTIHFGQDGGVGRTGTLYMLNNTVVTPYRDSVIELSWTGCKAVLVNNIFWSGDSKLAAQDFAGARKGGRIEDITGTHNWFSAVWAAQLPATGLDLKANFVAPAGANPPFVDPAKGNYHLARPDPKIAHAGLALNEVKMPGLPGSAGFQPVAGPSQVGNLCYREFAPPNGTRPRLPTPTAGPPDLGALSIELSDNK